jgi:hypothetical protein
MLAFSQCLEKVKGGEKSKDRIEPEENPILFYETEGGDEDAAEQKDGIPFYIVFGNKAQSQSHETQNEKYRGRVFE